MMNNTLKNPDINLSRGDIVFGKWHKHHYTIIDTLGYGANGYVYLALDKNAKHVALKLSDNSLSITSEVNVLKHFSKVQGFALGPSLIDVDDWEKTKGKQPISFYVMEYLKGENFLAFVSQRGNEWIGVLILQLLTDLEVLHNEGWVFGDLKPDNLIVSNAPAKVRMLDVGGTTIKGRAIKEFTEFFDRGYWGLGSRKAEPTYDLFSVAMIMVNACYPRRFQKDGTGMKQLKNAILRHPWLSKHQRVVTRALEGKYSTAKEMKLDLTKSLSKTISSDKTPVSADSGSNRSASRMARKQSNQKRRGKRYKCIVETLVLASIVFLVYFIYVYGNLL
ncbi:protein kinase domain-containing protein [Bacillus sp. FJAT-45066]|uniref:protein kinase domain-containing protein n=1 Tax=Bacillus sp. FJAT-45066 TaxID=2011010 RepID=UPI000BB73BE9|nr:serine/threonine protein kinase [Bacillus sp. FJAT-45066]